MTPSAAVCPICAADRLRTRFALESCNLVECGECGVGFIDPPPQDATSVYTDQYFADEGFYADYEASRRAFRVGFRTKLDVLRSLGASGRLLDIGCGFGDFMDEARAFGFSPHGIELAPKAAEAASKVGPVFRGDWLAFESPAPLDAITFIDSLEHFQDPVAAIRKTRETLSDGGFVAIMVPNIGSWFARLMGRRWHLILPSEHLFYFTETSIRRLLTQEGFEVVYLGGRGGGYGRSLGDVAAVLLRGTGWGRRLVNSALGRVVFEINLGDIFVVARKTA